MSTARNQISHFCDQLKQRRFDDATLQILQSILLHRDVQSLLEIRSRLTDFLRSESVIAIREVTEEPPEQKLFVLDFLVRASAIVDDVEACENALSCLQMNDISTREDLIESTDTARITMDIKKLKDVAIELSATHPVQVHTAGYLKCKTIRSLNQTSMYKQGLSSASTSFRNGIRRRNEVHLQRYQKLQIADENSYQIS